MNHRVSGSSATEVVRSSIQWLAPGAGRRLRQDAGAQGLAGRRHGGSPQPTSRIASQVTTVSAAANAMTEHPALLGALARDVAAGIPDEMPDAVQRVVVEAGGQHEQDQAAERRCP